MTTVGTSILETDARLAAKEVLSVYRADGFDVEPGAEDELEELALSGFRRLQDLRLLDRDDAEARISFQRARRSLELFVEEWSKRELKSGNRVLTSKGFKATQFSVCPVWPFK